MPFKIVKTIEEGAEKLCVVPSQWENKGILKYPVKSSDYKLYRDANSKPGRDWPTMLCKVKRSAIFTLKQANEVLKEMMQTSDTDHSVNDTKARDNDNVENSYNVLAEHLIINRHRDEGTSSNAVVEPLSVEYEFVTPTVNTAPVVIATREQQRNDNTQILELLQTNENLLLSVLQVCNTSLENQALLAEKVDALSDNLKKNSHKVASLSLQMDDGFSNIKKAIRESAAVIPLQLSNPDENSSFVLKPVDSVDDLENLELYLSDKIQKSKLKKQYSILCTTSVGNGGTCAYKLLDVMFSREFICKCSWSGGSRGKELKVGLKGYQNVLNFFFAMVNSWDPTFTLQDTEFFFKIVLKNSQKRKENKNIRASTKRMRKIKGKRGQIAKNQKDTGNKKIIREKEEDAVPGTSREKNFDEPEEEDSKEQISENMREQKNVVTSKVQKKQLNEDEKYTEESSYESEEQEQKEEQSRESMRKRKYEKVVTKKMQKKQLNEDEKSMEESSSESEEQEEKEEQSRENMRKRKKVDTQKKQTQNENKSGYDKNKYKKEATENEKSLIRREEEEDEEYKDDAMTKTDKESKFKECEQTRRNVPSKAFVEHKEEGNCKDNRGEAGRILNEEKRIKIVEDILVLKNSK